VDQNYRTRHGELDFVVRNDGTLVVVKLRRGTGFGDPLEAINLRKQRGVCW
jgi:putative endonuclease